VDPQTGAPAMPWTQGAIFESFLEGTTPENAQPVDPADLGDATYQVELSASF